ncbi:YugN-like family protein [Microaerobacter geothermalis]|uniref:YugN family protein n=1 Tax=Microaerobacter geothermalis TaxID=674972 RepID=UPI001F1B19EC|nr:YugN family protein [Microaerobacter geothermalis]MCF6095302.1 YugN-like family protein [Microaerobacter geothermalis]
MIIEGFSISGIQKTLSELDHKLESIGFFRWAWDYHQAHYDYKYEHPASGNVYFLRIKGVAVKGELENPHAMLKLEQPYIGKHLFPHGMDYEAEIPSEILNLAKNKLKEAEQKLS